MQAPEVSAAYPKEQVLQFEAVEHESQLDMQAEHTPAEFR